MLYFVHNFIIWQQDCRKRKHPVHFREDLCRCVCCLGPFPTLSFRFMKKNPSVGSLTKNAGAGYVEFSRLYLLVVNVLPRAVVCWKHLIVSIRWTERLVSALDTVANTVHTYRVAYLQSLIPAYWWRIYTTFKYHGAFGYLQYVFPLGCVSRLCTDMT